METAVVASCACPNNVFHRYMQGHQTVSARKSGIGDASLAPPSQTTIHQWLRRSWIHWCRFFNDCETSYCSGTPDALVLRLTQYLRLHTRRSYVCTDTCMYVSYICMCTHIHMYVCMSCMSCVCVCVCTHSGTQHATCTRYTHTDGTYMGPTWVVCLIPSYFRIHTHDLLVCMCTH